MTTVIEKPKRARKTAPSKAIIKTEEKEPDPKIPTPPSSPVKQEEAAIVPEPSEVDVAQPPAVTRKPKRAKPAAARRRRSEDDESDLADDEVDWDAVVRHVSKAKLIDYAEKMGCKLRSRRSKMDVLRDILLKMMSNVRDDILTTA